MFETLAARSERWGWWETGGLAAFAATVAFGLRWHEGWTDEAQAWMIARDTGWWQMMLHSLRYEGSPGLWHSLMWVLARLHLSYIGMHYVAGLLAVAGIGVFLRWAPFPRWLKLLLPLTFFLAYQDAVVARSYVLYTGLGFSAAALLRSSRGSPLLLAVLLGLIANLSIHGCIASAGLALVALWQIKQRGSLRDRRQWLAGAVLMALWLVAIGTAAPPKDIDFAAASGFHKARTWVADVHEKHGGHWVYGNDQIPVNPDPTKPHLVTSADAYHSVTMKPGELAPIPFTYPHFPLVKRWWLHIARFLGLLTFPLSTSRFLALLLVSLVVAYTFTLNAARTVTRKLDSEFGFVGLVPWALMIAAFMKLYIAPRHAGMLFTTFVISLWLIWPEANLEEDVPAEAQWLRVSLLTVLLLMVVQQISWTKDALIADEHYPYSGDWTTAAFLKTARQDGPVEGFYYHANGALAFLPGWKYANQPHSYWWWSTRLRTNQDAPKVLKQRPAYVVVGGFEWGDQGDITVDWANPYEDYPYIPMADAYRIVNYFERHGYIETHRFCGRLLMRDGYSEEVCNTILEPYVPED